MQGLRSSKAKGEETNGMNKDITCTWGEQRCQSKPKATLGYYLLTLGSSSDRKKEVGKQG